MAPITFSEFTDLVLVRLYELEQSGREGLVDLREIAQELKEPVSFEWIRDACRTLENRGLIRRVSTMGIPCQAQLTGEGRLYVEQHRGEGIISRYLQAPYNFVYVAGSGSQVAVGNVGGSVVQNMSQSGDPEVLALLGKIENALREDTSLTHDQVEDLIADVNTIRTQLNKKTPNPGILKAALGTLGDVASVTCLVATLAGLLGIVL